MEPRSRKRKATRHRRVKRLSPPRPAPASTPWPSVEAFFEAGEGEISIGAVNHTPTLRHTAVANDDHNMLVALVRRPGESLHQLLDRLEQALGPALDDQVFVDEINVPSSPSKSSRR